MCQIIISIIAGTCDRFHIFCLTLFQVADLKASIVELKLTEVDNEFSTYPAALSLELRQLNNKLAMAEDQNRLETTILQTSSHHAPFNIHPQF